MPCHCQSADGGRRERAQSLDELLELLSQRQRREMIRFLRDSADDRHSLDAVVDHLVAAQRDRTGTAPGQDHVLSVLVHVHGPKLEEAGVVEYDAPSREIRYFPDERIELALEKIEELAEEL